MTAYNPNKPDPGPSPKIDAPTIQNNFSKFGSIFFRSSLGVSYNHIAMNLRNQGDHAAVLMQVQPGDPGVVEAEATLYAKNALSNAGTQPQLFVQVPKFLPNELNPSNEPNIGMQLTYNTVNTAGPQYQSFLPGGYILYFGVDTGNTTPNVPIADVITLSPPPTVILAVILTPYTMTTQGTPLPFNLSYNIVSTFSFQINSDGNAISGPSIPYSIGWAAIGRA